MKNNVKNALNALGLLAFMGLAWATSPSPKYPEAVKMTVTINADSTAFILTNLENRDFNSGDISINMHKLYNAPSTDTLPAFYRSAQRIPIKANQTIMLPFEQFIGFKTEKERFVLSKKINVERFRFSNYLRKENGKRIYATFDFEFNVKPNGTAP